MTGPDNLVPDRDIDATNVRPAFFASLQFGATVEEIERTVGWRAADLATDGATVSGQSTYQHMELMVEKPYFPNFVLAAVNSYNASSLGVVGLACWSCSTVAQASECHDRFQHLTNRTVEFATAIEANTATLYQNRFGEKRLGCQLISDYSMLVAVHLLRSVAQVDPNIQVLRSERKFMPADERAAYEKFLDAPITLGADRSELVYNAAFLQSPVKSSDPGLAEHFQKILQSGSQFAQPQPALLVDVRKIIRDNLIYGTPTASEVARKLALGHRTLQRRLTECGHTFAEVLETTRRELASGYLADSTLTLAEVAYLLGYTDKASFHRAFRRWFETTPANYRQSNMRS